MSVTKKSRNELEKTANISYTTKSFGEKLVALRNNKKLTQAESAELIGITRNSLSMYERAERCPNIDIAVNAANVYNVSLDYLFGTGYKEQWKNHESLYNFFSEEALDFLTNSQNCLFVNAILSHPNAQKISDIIYAAYYKPLINSYEINYISRLISDLLYSMIVNVNKEAYQLRPMLDTEVEDLLNAVNHCIKNIEEAGYLLRTDYDKFMDCEDSIQTELERIKILLENAPHTSYEQARREGFQEAVKMFASSDIKKVSKLNTKVFEE